VQRSESHQLPTLTPSPLSRPTHVLHGTKRRVPLDPALLVEPSGHLVVESHGVVPRTLSASVKVLTSVFGDPDGLLNLVVVVGDVALEVFGLDKGEGQGQLHVHADAPPLLLTETS